jgi:hypothetical protein
VTTEAPITEIRVRHFLEGNPHSSVERILEDVAPHYQGLGTAERLEIWGRLRAALRHLEAQGLVHCEAAACGNLWTID